MKYRVGIDLGTTNTVCAVVMEGNPQPEIIKITHQAKNFDISGRERSTLLPSAVCIEKKQVFVGGIARYLDRFKSSTTFVSTKRFMGTDWRKIIDGEEWTPEKVAACILKLVRTELLTRFQQDPELAIITVPASFSTEARKGTLKAAYIAGFPVSKVQLFDEPTAALLDALLSNPQKWKGNKHSVHMVVDIGGGTLDVSLLHLSWGEKIIFDVIGRSRFNELAGDDFDLSIAGLLLHRWESDFDTKLSEYSLKVEDSTRLKSSPQQRILCGHLLRLARELKNSLSQQMAQTSKTEWLTLSKQILPFDTPAGKWSYTFTGEDLLNSLMEYFEQVNNRDLASEHFSFFRAIHQCLKSAEDILNHPFNETDVEKVWLAGGSAQLPIIHTSIQRMMFNPPELVSDCMMAIARGAARYAHISTTDSITLIERMFDGIYIQTSEDDFLCLISPRDEIPKKVSYENLLEIPAPSDGLIVKTFIGHTVEVDSGKIRKANPNLKPLTQNYVKFEEILPAKQAITVNCHVSKNKDIELEFIAHYNGKNLIGRVGIMVSDNINIYDEIVYKLPEINKVESRT